MEIPLRSKEITAFAGMTLRTFVIPEKAGMQQMQIPIGLIKNCSFLLPTIKAGQLTFALFYKVYPEKHIEMGMGFVNPPFFSMFQKNRQ
jgi:hypothetical protein